MKKTALILIIVMVAALTASMLSSCYVSRPAALKKVVGTYALTAYSHTYSPEEGEEEAKTIDLIKEKEIKAYLVVGSDGKGYYVYSDKDTAVTARVVNISYMYDDEDSSKVKEITYTDGANTSGDGAPNKGHETLGVYFKWKTKKLTYTMPAVFGRKYSQSVRYEKVDKATDLSYVSKEMGVSLVAPAYEVAQLDGVLSYEGIYDAASPYVYYYIDYHPERGQATVYYLLKSDGVAQTFSDQRVTFTVNATEENGMTSGTIDFVIGNTPFSTQYYGSPVNSLSYHGEGYEMWFGRSTRNTVDINAMITDATERYNEYIAAQEE